MVQIQAGSKKGVDLDMSFKVHYRYDDPKSYDRDGELQPFGIRSEGVADTCSDEEDRVSSSVEDSSDDFYRDRYAMVGR